jgi:PAS domain S-box-containing protein
MLTTQNSTDHGLSDEATRKSEANLNAIIENSDVMIYSLDAQFRYTTFNTLLKHSTKIAYGIDIKVGDNIAGFLEKLEPTEAQDWRVAYTKTLAGQSLKFEKSFNVDNVQTYNSFSLNPIWENSRVIGLSCFVRDITEQKVGEERLRQSERRYRNIVETAQEGIWIIDKHDCTDFVNKKLCEIFEYSEEEMMGRKLYDFMDEEGMKIATEGIRLGKTGVHETLDFKFITKSGKMVWTNLSNSPLFDNDRNYIGSLSMVTDITNKKIYQESLVNDLIEKRKVAENLEKMVEERTHKLNEALKKEKELVELKSKFISIASHEFRTPLSTILLATGIIKKYKQKLAPVDMEEKLANIEKQVAHMTFLLDDVLNVGRADAGKIQVNLTEVSTDIFEKMAIDAMRGSETRHELRFSMDCGVIRFMTDEKLIRNVIINLTTNAVKFSPKAKFIEMKVSCDAHKLYILVKDQGIGIPKEDMKDLFTSFSRGSNVGAIEGTGIGLSIAKKAIELLSGTLEVQSEIGKGTEFRVALPV